MTRIVLLLLVFLSVEVCTAQTDINGSQIKFYGPRPYVDVTAYGARGDGKTDDTSAIQSAIDAACKSFRESQVAGGTLVFPPGVYIVSQSQLPSMAPIFSFPKSCSPGMRGLGGTSGGSPWPVMASGAEILVNHLGSAPNAAPVFAYTASTSTETRLSNLTIVGHNQAISVTNNQPFILENVCLTTPATGQVDNVPLKLSSQFWFWWKGGCIQSGSPTLPVVLIVGETVSGGDAASQLLYFSDLLTTGGPFEYIQRDHLVGGPAGQWVFRNITMESQNSDILDILESGNPGPFAVNGITFDHVIQSDAMLRKAAILGIKAPHAGVSGVYIIHSYAGNGGEGVAIRVSAGYVIGYQVSDCVTACTAAVVDANDNATGNGTQQTYFGGIDSVFNSNAILNGTYPDRLQSQITANSTAVNSPANRWFQSGTSIATLGIDPLLGFLFNDGHSYGFNASVNESSVGIVNFNYADTLPPTHLVGVAASGGSLPNGTYTAVIRSTAVDNCTAESAPSSVSEPVVLSVSKGSIDWTWSLPADVYAGKITGYCLTRGVGAGPFTNKYIFIEGGKTTSYADTGANMVGGVNPMVNRFSNIGTHQIGAKLAYWGSPEQIKPTVFSALPSCNSSALGTFAAVSDSSANNWGTTISGGGHEGVLAFCDGSNWTVMGK